MHATIMNYEYTNIIVSNIFIFTRAKNEYQWKLSGNGDSLY